MLNKIRHHVSKAAAACNHACRIVAAMTAGEAVALVTTAVHWDFATGYLIVSAWVKDAIVRRHARKAEAKRKSVKPAKPFHINA